MNTLRDKVAALLATNNAMITSDPRAWVADADAILAIPEMAEALAIIPPGPITATKQERTEIIRRVNDAFGATGL
jgi:hypothetical protein